MKVVSLFGTPMKLSGNPTDDYFAALPDLCDVTDNVLLALKPFVAETAVVLDVGANIGLYSLGAATIAKKGKIYSFEPSVRTFRYLAENAIANGCGDRIEPVNSAVGDTTGTTLLHETLFSAGNWTVSDDDDPAGTSVAIGSDLVEVHCTTLDDFVFGRGLDRVDVIKIDVEGAEPFVLSGASRVLSEFRPVVVVEFNSCAFWMHHDLLPKRVLEDIRNAFDDVYVIDRETGTLSPIESEADVYRLLHMNGTAGPVDNLLCSFEGSPVIVLDAHREVILAENAALKAESERLSAEVDAMQRTVSWRLTRPLRVARRLWGGLRRG